MIDLLLHNLRTIGTHHCDGTVGEEAADEIERLRAEVAGLREDAARYRWLRSPNTGPATIWELISDECNPPYMTLKYGANLDAAIDAALAARKGEA